MEAERGSTTDLDEELIGLLLNKPDLYFDIAERFRAEYLDSGDMRSFYRAISAVHSQGSEFSWALVEEHLPNPPSGQIPALWIPSIAAAAPSNGSVEERADAIRKRYLRKQARNRVLPDVTKIATDGEMDADDIPLALLKAVEDAFAEDNTESTRGAIEMAGRARKRREEARSNTGGFLTGFDPFDVMLGPFLPAQVTVIGGAPSMGKSALAQEIAWNAATSGVPTLLHTNEMSGEEAWDRMVCQMARVSGERLIRGTLSESEEERAAKAEYELQGCPIFLDDSEKPKLGKLRLTVQRMKRKHGIRLVVIDHLQFVDTDKPVEKEYLKLVQVTSGFKAMAKKLQVHVILVSHLSREGTALDVRNASDIRRPKMTDLHGSSTIEKDADNILFVHRPIYYLERNPQENRSDWAADVVRWRGKAELLKVKKRGGKGFGIKEIEYIDECTLFVEEGELPMDNGMEELPLY
jgi:replicative DNA helicase